MQLGSVYLYPNRLSVYTNLNSWLSERNRAVYNRNLKIYRGVDNRLEFRVKNSDQKPQSVQGKNFVFNLVSRDNAALAIRQDCVIDNAAEGRISVTIPTVSMDELEPGFYEYSLVYETRQAVSENQYKVLDKSPAYVDSQYGVMAIIEVLANVEGEPPATTEIREFSKYVQPWHDEDYFDSGVIFTGSQLVNYSSVHTFQFYFTDYTGRVMIQGSIDEGGNPQTWTDLQTIEYIGADREYTNVIGKYNYFRVRHMPYAADIVGSFQIGLTIFGNYNVTVIEGGQGYTVGNTILIKGNRLGGEQTTNDLRITVQGVDLNGAITSITWEGRSYNGTTQFTIANETVSSSGRFDKILYR
jgi:hypothetical protein